MLIRDCYHVLSDCLSGEAPKHINQESSFFLFENIQKLARTMKSEKNNGEEEFLEKCLKTKEVKCYSGKRKVCFTWYCCNQIAFLINYVLGNNN